jgi:glycosyltransferase involved in cell wall biosynthesis
MRRIRPRELRSAPSVTVVVPCYNYGHFLQDAVQGVLDQPGVEVDVIIVDDASTDGSRDVAARLASSDERVTVVQHEHNMRHIATYNDGLLRATGDYVVLLSADDMLSEGSLQRSVALMEACPEVALVYGHAPTFTDVVPPSTTRVRHWSVFGGDEWIDRICARGTNIIVNPEAVLRTSVMKQLGGYDAAYPQAADMLLWMRAATLGSVGRVNGPDQAFYRVHGANMHMTDFGGHLLTETAERRAVFDRFFATDGASLPAREAWADKARRSVALEALRSAIVQQDRTADGTDRSAAELAQFAVDCDPSLRDRRIWRSYERRRRGPVSRARRVSTVRLHDVRWATRWRRWRRYGT